MPNIIIGHAPKLNKSGNPSLYIFTRWHVLTETGEFLCGRVSAMDITDQKNLPQEAFGKDYVDGDCRDKIPKKYREIYPTSWADFYTCFTCYQKLNPKPKKYRLLKKPTKTVETNQLNLW